MSTGLEKCLQKFATMFPAIAKCLQCETIRIDPEMFSKELGHRFVWDFPI
jgi:hypothetical protein